MPELGMTQRVARSMCVRRKEVRAMSGPIVRSGASPQFSKNWESIFGKKSKSTATAEKPTAKKKTAKKPTKKAKKK
jgi:hypothetical protein